MRMRAAQANRGVYISAMELGFPSGCFVTTVTAITALVGVAGVTAIPPQPAPVGEHLNLHLQCAATQEKPYLQFGTHTAYPASDSETNASEVNVQDCQPEFFWLLTRHGTRYPSRDDITTAQRVLGVLKEKVYSNFIAGKAYLCQPDAERIGAWALEPDAGDAFDLASQGEADNFELASRFKTRFPQLLGTLNLSRHSFWHDESARTQASAEWFARGLLGYVPPLDGLHPLNDFYKHCPAFDELKNSPDFQAQRKKFEVGEEMNETIARVSRRLGFLEAGEKLSFEDIRIMYSMCGFERAWNWRYGKISAWCAAFSEEDYEVLEYMFDLHEYFRTGHGHQLHVKLGCLAVKEMTDKLKSKIEGNEPKAAIHYFSHDTLLNMVYAHLGLFKDKDTLTAASFKEHKDRQWRTSRFSPFLSNLAAVLLKCGGDDKPDKSWHVRIMLGEKTIKLPECLNEMCPWNTFMEKYGENALNACDINELCHVEKKT